MSAKNVIMTTACVWHDSHVRVVEALTLETDAWI